MRSVLLVARCALPLVLIVVSCFLCGMCVVFLFVLVVCRLLC